MKAAFNKTHFLLVVLFISLVMLFAAGYFATEANKTYALFTLAFNALTIALMFYLLVSETNKTAHLHLELQQREKYLSETLDSLVKSKSTTKSIREQNEELENRVKERTEELEFFIYSVSHDLRAPLRTINGFSKILRDEYMMKCDADGKSLISTIASSAQQMDHLVENMLRLARLGKSELRKSPTDMKALVNEVISDMKTLHLHHAMEIVMNDLPEADCDSGLMKQVWTNLISNAVKYSAKHPSPKVEIGYGKKNGSDFYYVKDNGVGFDMQYAHKLFGAFQRLHHADEFEGTGVGLVIVSRVIKKHGGRVFAESESGKGASFYFALPEKN